MNYNLTPVESSNVDSMGPDGDDLLVRFKSSPTIYRYKGAAPLHEEALASDSVGRFIGQRIRGQYDFERIEPDQDDDAA